MRFRYGWLATLLVFAACEEKKLAVPPIGKLAVKDRIDFGDVQVGMTGKVELEIGNSGTASYKVLEVQLDKSFAPAGFKLNVPVPFVLAPKTSQKFTMEYVSKNAGTISESSFKIVTDIVQKEKQVIGTVAVSANAIAPGILIEPNPVDFGPVLLGSQKTIDISITNTLGITVDLLAAGDGPFMVEGQGTFTLDMGSARSDGTTVIAEQVAAGETVIVKANYMPTAVMTDTATATIMNCADPLCGVELTLTGAGTDAAIICDPVPLDFGNVDAGDTKTLTTTCTNRAPEDVVVTGWALTGSPAFTVPAYAGSPKKVAPGESFDIDLTFTPTNLLAAQPQPLTATLAISSRNDSTGTETEPGLVPMKGVAVADSVLSVTCSADQTTPAGTAVTVVATPQGAVGATTVLWTVVSGPASGIGTPGQWAPNPPKALTEQFLAHIVGDYVLRATVTDSVGSATCDTKVSAEGHGLRVELTWNGSGDVDLHMHNQNTAVPWFDSASSADCYFGETAPIWDNATGPKIGKNPGLDVDNTFGNGPENIRVDVVALNQDYYVGVHAYSTTANGRVATIKIFCGEVTTPNNTFTSHALVATESGNCKSGNEFWKVAKVRFTSQTTCQVTQLNTYSPSSNVCSAF